MHNVQVMVYTYINMYIPVSKNLENLFDELNQNFTFFSKCIPDLK